MKRDVDRILTTHAGSLPRPPELLSLLLAKEAGEVDDARFATELRKAVGAVVHRQSEVGVDVVNDGEMGKPSYATYVKDRLTGFGGEGSFEEISRPVLGRAREEFPDFAEQMARTMATRPAVKLATCTGPVSFRGEAAVRADIDNLKGALDGASLADTFMSSASPGVIAVFAPNRYYGSDEEYLEALANAMRPEYEAIHDAGILLQLDCPDFAMVAPGAGSVENFRRQLGLAVEALNHAVANIPPDAMRIHVCWGNGEFPRTSDVELKDIVDLILRAKPDGIMVMGSNGRHEHEWKVFRDVKLPEGKYLIPGVVDSTTNVVEHPEVVADRLLNYAGVVGRENVLAGTDCGFGTFAGMATVAPSVAWVKLRAMAEGAQMASEQLWG